MTRPTNITVACCQLAPRFGDLAYNRQLTERAIRSAAVQGAQVVVLPELIQSGYCFADPIEALSLSETTNGPTLRLWTALARELNLVIVGGFCERLKGNELANSAAMIDASGLLAVYRKAHLWDAEKAIFKPGHAASPVVDTAHGRIGMLICYDLEFPEWVRLPALAGADLLCAPVNWPIGPSLRPQTERSAEIVRVQANASVNHIFIAACDRHGSERGTDWVQGSIIVDVDGYPLTDPTGQGGEQILLARLNLSDAGDKRISDHNDLHDDRRTQLYAPSTQIHPEELLDMSMKEELKELLDLIRQNVTFDAFVANSPTQIDQQLGLGYQQRKMRIEEISQRYGLL